MIYTDRVVVVEGKYDEIKLSSIIDATIIKTDGFGIFKDSEKQKLLLTLAQKRGLIVLTDSDSAGFMIRNFLNSKLPADRIINVYVPDIYGKERRKTKASSEGKLGVEGIPTEVLLEAFERAGITEHLNDRVRALSTPITGRQITNIDLYEDGIIGGPDSRVKRRELQRKLDLPERLSAKGLVKIINILITYDEYKELIKEG